MGGHQFGFASWIRGLLWQSGVWATSALAASWLFAATTGRGSQLKLDENVILFPTAAALQPDGKAWTIPVHGWIFEPEQTDLLRRITLRQLRRALQLESEQAASDTFNQRARAFLVDNERGKTLSVRIAGQTHSLGPSDVGGHFSGTIVVDAETVAEYAEQGRLLIQTVQPPEDSRTFTGTVHLIPPTGTSVISDIDDTIKISDVRDRKQLIQNTFFHPFRAVDGMAALYRRWSEAGAEFHFVSSSPWQLFEPLSEFLADSGFPSGTFHLKRFRLVDRTALDLLADPLTTKPPIIERLLRSYPGRRFILVGDSGEQDPEVYGLIARKHPNQIWRIYIRNVTDETSDSPRYKECFRELPAERWQLFDDPHAIKAP
jgi:phosphatidate phosphatase APP1